MMYFPIFALCARALLGQMDLSDYPDTIAVLDEDIEMNTDPSLVDLEQMSDDFVLETKKIDIPGYATAFNPSILRWKDAFLLSFRIRDPMGLTNNFGLIWLDKDFKLASAPYVVEVRGTTPEYPSKQQDPRLIAVGNKIYMIFSNSIEGINQDIRRMHIAELHFEKGKFYLDKPECISRYAGASNQRWEKNWVPFDFDGKLYLAYSIFPHNIFSPILGTGACETIASTFGSIKWEWGVLRGGTPALPLDEKEYLAFFHSSILMPTVHSGGKKIQHYFMGAYTFSRKHPFSITRISPKPIVGKNFYRGLAYKTWKPLCVVFPCGYVMDDRYVWVVYGRQDHEIWVVKLDKQKLLNTLILTK